MSQVGAPTEKIYVTVNGYIGDHYSALFKNKCTISCYFTFYKHELLFSMVKVGEASYSYLYQSHVLVGVSLATTSASV